MKVTPDMFDAVVALALSRDWTGLPLDRVRECWLGELERALSPLPEPTETVRELNKRITALTMRLERVREWRAKQPNPNPFVFRSFLDATPDLFALDHILEDEAQP